MFKHIIFALLLFMVEEVACLRVVNAFGSSRRFHTSMSMKSKDEIENEKGMIKIKTLESIFNVEILRLRSRELDLQAAKQQEERNLAILKIQIEEKRMNQSKEIEEKRMKERYFLSITFFLLFYLFGIQLRDGLLGRVTTFNSVITEFKAGILKRLTSLNIILGLLICKEFLYKRFMKICGWFHKVIRI